jgi:hypothetical protein
MRNAYKILGSEPEEGDRFSDLSIDEKVILKWILNEM